MLGELAREAEARVEDALIALRRLSGGGQPGWSRSIAFRDRRSSGTSPCGMRRSSVQRFVRPHGFNVGGGVALMVVEIGEGVGAGVALLAIPDADVVRVGSGDEQEACAEGLAPMCGCAEFVVGNIGEFARRFAAAIRAGRVAEVGEFEMLEKVWR